NGVYYITIVGDNQTSLRLTRLAADGTQLEPDDDFNQIPGGHVIYSPSTNRISMIDIDRVGDQIVVTFFDKSFTELEALRIDPATGQRANGAVTVQPSSFASGVGSQYLLSPVGGGAMLFTDSNLVTGVTLSGDNRVFGLIANQNRKPIGVVSSLRTDPS